MTKRNVLKVMWEDALPFIWLAILMAISMFLLATCLASVMYESDNLYFNGGFYVFSYNLWEFIMKRILPFVIIIYVFGGTYEWYLDAKKRAYGKLVKTKAEREK